MDVSALSQSLSTQAAMGLLVTKVLDQATSLVQQQQAQQVAMPNVEAASEAVDESLGQILDVLA